MLHFEHFNFVLVSLFLAEHAWHPILFPSRDQWLCVVFEVLSFGWWLGFVFLVLWFELKAPSLSVALGSSPVSVWIVNLIIFSHGRQNWNEFEKQSVCIMNLNLKYSSRRKVSWILLCCELWNERKYIEELSMYDLKECSVPGIYVLLE